MIKHTFHIPVMGIGYTLDTPIKVAKYGISSAISVVQDDVIEKARKYYSGIYGVEYHPITKKESNYRSKRITAYLNLVNLIVSQEFKLVKSDPEEQKKLLDLLPYSEDLTESEKNRVLQTIQPGAIDVNIMTKLDRPGSQGERGHYEACSALKGFAESDLTSSIILSAGLNPRLFAFMQDFPDFFPNESGQLRKKVILKVSDFRSAQLQGKMLAKKGIWVSEYRVESGLNCGGHTFATQGHLLGPVLNEFKANRKAMRDELLELCNQSLIGLSRPQLDSLDFKLTVQGGIGSSSEREFLHKQYGVDSTGWGSPFLLVPEATSIDDETLIELTNAGEDDIYVSNVSPLGVKFNTIRNNSADRKRQERIANGKPGSPCFKKHLALNENENGKLLCTASVDYQSKKIKELDAQNLSAQEHHRAFDKITEKECLCNGLALSFLTKFGLNDRTDSTAVSICPGPNLAYFNRTYTLQEMVDHIYGRANIIELPRPNIFLKELGLYVRHLQEEISAMEFPITRKAEKYIEVFRENLLNGIVYYSELKESMVLETQDFRQKFESELCRFRDLVNQLEPEPALAY